MELDQITAEWTKSSQTCRRCCRLILQENVITETIRKERKIERMREEELLLKHGNGSQPEEEQQKVWFQFPSAKRRVTQ